MTEKNENWTAVYWRHRHRYEMTFLTLKETLDFLHAGEYEGTLFTEGIIRPDGTMITSPNRPARYEGGGADYTPEWHELVATAQAQDVTRSYDFWDE